MAFRSRADGCPTLRAAWDDGNAAESLQQTWRRETGLNSPVKYFTDRSKAVLLLWICFLSFLCLLCLCARLFTCALWSPAWKGLTSWLSFVVAYCEFVTSGSGAVLDCIDSLSLHPYLLTLASTKLIKK